MCVCVCIFLFSCPVMSLCMCIRAHISRLLCSFRLLNTAAMNMEVQISFWVSVLINTQKWKCWIMWYDGCGKSVLIYIPHQSFRRVPFPHILIKTYFLSFDNSPSKRCKVISHCCLESHFPDSWAYFMDLFLSVLFHLPMCLFYTNIIVF